MGRHASAPFEDVKSIVRRFRDHHRVPLDYPAGADPVWLITDASLTGAGGAILQGKDWRNAKVVSFWSGKVYGHAAELSSP